jgi:uncharacterized protein
MATDAAAFEIRSFPGVGESKHLITRITSDLAPFWDGLNSGQLVLQNCSSCGRSRYPVAPVCPYCRTSAFKWKTVSGAGSVFSWIRYHKSYLPEFEPLMPYCVLSVQLDAGPRMFGRLASLSQPSTDMRVTVIGERWADGRILPAFIEEQEN